VRNWWAIRSVCCRFCPLAPAARPDRGPVGATALGHGGARAAARPNHLTVKDVRELVATEYLRPIPAQSDYLDTATKPAPWPTRPETRQPRGGRPILGAEKRAATLTRTSAKPGPGT